MRRSCGRLLTLFLVSFFLASLSSCSGDSRTDGVPPGEIAGSVNGFVYRTLQPGEAHPESAPPGLVPVEDATAALGRSASGSLSQQTGLSTQTGEDGSFTITGVPPGDWTVTVSKSGFDNITKSVNVGVRENAVAFNRGTDQGYLPRTGGTDFRVTSDPPGARISIDGRDTGAVTPFTFRDMAPGSFNVLVVREGNTIPSQQSVTIEPGQGSSSQNVVLSSLPDRPESEILPPPNQSGEYPEVNSNYRVRLRRGSSTCPGDLGEGAFVATLGPGDGRIWHFVTNQSTLTVSTSRRDSNNPEKLTTTGSFENRGGDFDLQFNSESGSAGPVDVTARGSISGRLTEVAGGGRLNVTMDGALGPNDADCELKMFWTAVKSGGPDSAPELPARLDQAPLPSADPSPGFPEADGDYRVTLREGSSTCPDDLPEGFFGGVLAAGDTRTWTFSTDGENVTLDTARSGDNPEGRSATGSFDNRDGDFSLQFDPESGSAGPLDVTGFSSVSGRLTPSAAAGTAVGEFDGSLGPRDVECRVTFLWDGRPAG